MSATLLLDADIIAFQIAAGAQKTIQFDPECEPSIILDDWEEVQPRIHSYLENLMETLGTEKVIVCLSCPTAENWRLRVLPTYKANRDYSKRPVHLGPIKDYMESTWPSYRRPTLEADDIMGILSTHPSLVAGKKIIVSEDKDMKTIPGWLYNPAKDAFGPREVSTAEADAFHMEQTICGDVTDGYAGCPGAGPSKAATVLSGGHYSPFTHTFKSGPRKGQEEIRWILDAESEAPTWDRIVSLYERYGYTEADALIQARVSRILRDTDFNFTTKEVLLWNPDSTALNSVAKTA